MLKVWLILGLVFLNAAPVASACEEVFAQGLKIYYAHPTSSYDTEQERLDLAYIQQTFPTAIIINPNSSTHEENYRARGMSYFEEVCAQCNLCIFRSFPNGAIGAGVAKEISVFVLHSKVVLELPTGIADRTLNVEDTRAYLRLLKHQKEH